MWSPAPSPRPFPRDPSTKRRRQGAALVAALSLLALAAALTAGGFASAIALSRSARSAHAAARVETGGRRALAEVVAAWNTTLDSMPVGVLVERPLPSDTTGTRPPLLGRARIQRVGARLFVVSVDVRVGEGTATLARRRYRLTLERAAGSYSDGAMPPPKPIMRWSFAELF